MTNYCFETEFGMAGGGVTCCPHIQLELSVELEKKSKSGYSLQCWVCVAKWDLKREVTVDISAV